jgi:AraC family transcriptional regulator, regulatory protein of adaptative response / methylated-DNA-[protein]-cysteine methyltransferase
MARRFTDMSTCREMERAFVASDPAADGRFVAAVCTTGIFCRPSCRARKPLPANVDFLADPMAARAAGYRPCLRCHPEAADPVALREIDTPIGRMTLGATADALVLADFTARPMMPTQLAAVRRRIGPTDMGGASPVLDTAERQLHEYLGGARRKFDLAVDAPGSPFQERVWAELAGISYGATISYRELARRVDAPTASRAVGRANGSNRLAVVIPCHRVVAANGSLGGYGGGLAAKRFLLDLERRAAATRPAA